MPEESDWLESLKVGDEVALNHFNGKWVIGKVIQLGKSKGRRFKIEYGRDKFELWLNDFGRAKSGDYNFAHIERLTDRIRDDVAKAHLRQRVISKASRLDKGGGLDRLSLEELRSIDGLLDLIHDLLPKEE